MVHAKVAELSIPSEEIAALVVHHQLLNELRFLDDVQVEASGWLSGPTKVKKT